MKCVERMQGNSHYFVCTLHDSQNQNLSKIQYRKATIATLLSHSCLFLQFTIFYFQFPISNSSRPDSHDDNIQENYQKNNQP